MNQLDTPARLAKLRQAADLLLEVAVDLDHGETQCGSCGLRKFSNHREAKWIDRLGGAARRVMTLHGEMSFTQQKEEPE